MKLGLTLIVFLTSFIAYAEEYEYRGQCQFKGYMNVFITCLDKELAKYDAELNKLYRIEIARSPNSGLREVELLWIKFKEKDCEYMAKSVIEGKEFESIHRICLINKTKLRIRDLRRSYLSSNWY